MIAYSRQKLRSVDIRRIFEKLRGGRAQIAQHKIYRHQYDARHHSRFYRRGYKVLFIAHASCFNGVNYDDSKCQRRKRVHSLITLYEALCCGVIDILPARSDETSDRKQKSCTEK